MPAAAKRHGTRGVKLAPFQKDLIRLMVQYDALQFGKFTLQNGRVSPYYFNMRRLTDGGTIMHVGGIFARKIIQLGLKPDVVFGPSYAAIPLAVATAIALTRQTGRVVHFAFDRKEAKPYGADHAVLGRVQDGDKVLIVDDVVVTGATKLDVQKKIRMHAKARFLGILIACDRMEKDDEGNVATRMLARHGLPVCAILDAAGMFDYLHNRKIGGKVHVDDPQYAAFQTYLKQYGA